ncbi:MAG: FAD/NAD(P)-binding protein [Nitrospirae bacterium]|nr:FAD/NAD(P)-binding protein [Nitrospirota bacterium]
MAKDNNIYLPSKALIKDVTDLSCDVKLFKVMPEKKTQYLPGQFFMLSLWGTGEVPISITSTIGLQKHIELGIKKVGKVTSALHELKAGDTLWLRGPYGNNFNADISKGKDVIFIAGGIGILPLRSLINFVLMNKKEFGRVFLIYGSKNTSNMLFTQEIKQWAKKGLEIILTVDETDKRWKGSTGLVTGHLDKIKTDFKKASAYVCGPEIMIENTMKELSLRGMPDKLITTTLEARMKCGMGKCGQCYHGIEYICTNGPVYSYEEMKKRLY